MTAYYLITFFGGMWAGIAFCHWMGRRNWLEALEPRQRGERE